MPRSRCLFLLFSWSLGVAGGCQLAAPPPQVSQPEFAEVAVVDVGGAVTAPQAVPLAAGGLTLKQAIIRAGGVRADELPRWGELLVACQRGATPWSSITYYPLPLVMEHLAGHVRLRGGDVVAVVHYSQTSLVHIGHYRDTSSGGRVAVQGLSGPPQSRRIEVGPLGDPQRLVTLGDLCADQMAQMGAPLPLVLVLERTAASGLATEQYVLPLFSLSGGQGYFHAQPLADGDACRFTRLELLPEVLAGVVTPLVQQKTAEKFQ